MRFSNILNYINSAAILAIAAFLYHSYSGTTEKDVQIYSDASVEQYILNNPKVIMAALEHHQDAMLREQQENQKKFMQSNLEKIYKTNTDPRAGNAKAKIKIVEFFDYNCGYCKVMMATKEKLLKENKNIEIIFKELPVLGEASSMQAQSAIAVHAVDPKRYFAFHTALLKAKNEYKDFESIKGLVSQIGVDEDKFEEAYKDPKTIAKIKENLDLAYALGIRGTPAYIAGDQIIPGAVGYQELLNMVSSEKRAN